jgi:hypothetical protein
MINGNNIHPFESYTGSARITSPYYALFLFLFLVPGVWLIASLGIMGAIICIGIPALLIYGYHLFRNPVIGLYSAVAFSFLLIGTGRYVKNVQVGLGMDAVLLVTYLALFFNRFHKKTDWSPVQKDITYISILWLLYSLFQIFNPESRSLEAWFSGRGVGLYMFLLVPLTLLFFTGKQKIYWFLYVWAFFSLLASLKGIMQIKIGLDAGEQGWLNDGNFKTHVLFGKLRAFSFLSDAGQFGANQGYSAVVMLIAGYAARRWKQKLFFFTVAIFAVYGMIISGTRGALAVPFAGLALFFILRKNIAVLSIGTLLLFIVIFFFKFTTIGQGNADIRRMRTAFDPNDASLQVRLNNQKILKGYMATRPFGGGIGHGGVKAQRFLPNAYLSQIPTDSWYVLIWVEQGIVGLTLHILILLYILIKSCYKIMFRIRDPQLKLLMAGLVSGMFGIMVASYGNAVLGQMPTNIMIYISMALLLNTDRLDQIFLKTTH